MRASGRAALVVAWSLACAASALAGDAYEITTPGSPGTGGAVPALTGEGAASPGSANSLLLADALPHAPALLVFSVSELAAPFAGGVLGPAPDFIAALGITGADGALEKRFRVPDNAPVGLELWLQAWVRDAGGAAGFSASNTLRVTVRPEVPVELMYPGALYALHVDGAALAASDLVVVDMDLDGRDDVVLCSEAEAAGLFLLRNDPDQVLGGAPTLLASGATSALVVGDLDADGAPDIVAAHPSDTITSVRLGDGEGGVIAAPSLSWNAFPKQLQLQDLDLDGTLDLLVSKIGSTNLSYRLGAGDGGFGAEQTHAPGGSVSAFTVADVNADGLPDLLAVVLPPVIPLPQRLSVSLAEPGGGYAPAQLATLGGLGAVDLAAVDLDGDGLLDVVVANQNSDELRIACGLGAGAFTPAEVLIAGGRPVDLLVTDLDGDGADDLVVANAELDELSVYFVEPGTALVPEPVAIPTGDAPMRVFACELQADGCVDLLTSTTGSFLAPVTLTAFVGLGDGEFLVPVRHPANPSVRDLVLCDVDGDALLDAVVCNSGVDRVTLLRGLGDGGFAPKQGFPVADQPYRLAAGDLDGDGGDDIVVVSGPVQVEVLLSGDDGSLGPATPIAFDGPFPSEISLRDLDGDGALDLVGVPSLEPSYFVMLGTGDGGFGPTTVFPAALETTGHAVADLDADGVLDLVLGHGGAGLEVRLGVGDGRFGAATEYPLGGIVIEATSLAIGDLDGDGVHDLVTTRSFGESVAVVFLGVGDGTFAAPQFNPTVADGFAAVHDARIIDVNGDGLLDFVGGSPDVCVMLGDGSGALAPGRRFGVAQAVLALAVGDLDQDELPEVVIAGTPTDQITVYANQLEP